MIKDQRRKAAERPTSRAVLAHRRAKGRRVRDRSQGANTVSINIRSSQAR
jgi:hypothetical protein